MGHRYQRIQSIFCITLVVGYAHLSRPSQPEVDVFFVNPKKPLCEWKRGGVPYVGGASTAATFAARIERLSLRAWTISLHIPHPARLLYKGHPWQRRWRGGVRHETRKGLSLPVLQAKEPLNRAVSSCSMHKLFSVAS